MGEEPRLLKIPCVFCGHGNPPGHRFCGMCGKALPDLVKQSKPVQGASGSAVIGGGMGAAGRPVTPTPSPIAPKVPVVGTVTSAPLVRKAPAARVENPNRDLSYLLHDDDPVAAPTSRTPFVIGGLILAAVAGFFILRGGGKKTPVVDPAAGDAAVSQTAPADGKAETAKAEAAKVEPSPVEAPKSEAGKVEAGAETAVTAPPLESHRAAPSIPVPVVAAPVKPHAEPAPRAARAAKKPAPSRHAVAAAPEDEEVTPVSSAEGDCESQLPSLRKAAARGDAKARANLGLAYYAGRCVPRDLPTSYHWYALALRTEPNSPLVSAQLEAIWKQMSPAEKQLALKAQ